MISLAVSNEQSTIFLMWAHVGDQVSEYVVYVNNIETITVNSTYHLLRNGFTLIEILLDYGERF